MGFSLGHWLVVLAVTVIVFGAGRVPKAMGDLARGIRAFRSGVQEDTTTEMGSDQLVKRRRTGQTAATGLRGADRTSSTVRRDA